MFMKLYENLSDKEKGAIMKFPAYISLLASNADGKLDDVEKKEAKHFSHIKTFSCDQLLSSFYEDADKVFSKNITELDDRLPENKTERETAIKRELANLEPILHKLGGSYTSAIHKSMISFTKHVSKAHHNVLELVILPFYNKDF